MKIAMILSGLVINLLLMVGCTQASLGSKKAIVYPLFHEPKTLDPALATDLESILVLQQIQVGLTRQDSVGNLVPGLAERWERLDDGRRIRFYLRPAKWSDSKPVRAADFAFAWLRVLDPKIKSPWGQRLSCIEGASAYLEGTGLATDVKVKAISDSVLDVGLLPGGCDILRIASYTGYVPQREDIVRASPNEHSSPSNLRVTGPFFVKAWESGVRIVLNVNPRYYGSRAQLDRVELRLGLNAGAVYTLYEQGALDVLYPVPQSETPRVQKNPDRMLFVIEPFNLGDVLVKPLDYVKVSLLAKPSIHPFPLGITGIPSFVDVPVGNVPLENEG